MKSKITFLILRSLAFLLILGNFSLPQADDLKTFTNVRLIENMVMDGDSFHVKIADKILYIRLYFVDCPETSTASKTDAQRVLEQMRYFGLTDAVITVHYGNVAKEFTAKMLSKPFKIYTSYANALGRSSGGRFYAFVITGKGEDLSSLLVKNGLARSYGVGRKTPDGIARDEMVLRLRDLETAAMLKRIGIWSASDPDRIAELRAEQRREDDKLKDLQQQIIEASKANQVLDPNTASKKELETIPGVGPKIADRIIAGRPYKNVDDLLKIKGIGPKKLEKMRHYLNVK